MVWLRSRLKPSSYVALFAMALQLALSFGHIHLDYVSAGSGQTSVQRAASATLAGLRAADELPAQPGDECAVCALIALANSLIMPLPALLPVPMQFAVAQHEAALVFHLTAVTLRSFQARAPPLV
jgi:hypothetical protein